MNMAISVLPINIGYLQQQQQENMVKNAAAQPVL